MKKKEYDEKIHEIIDEEVFKLITSPYAFLSLDWKTQRDMLVKMAGGAVTDGEIAGKIKKIFDLRPYAIVKRFGLKNPIFDAARLVLNEKQMVFVKACHILGTCRSSSHCLPTFRSRFEQNFSFLPLKKCV